MITKEFGFTLSAVFWFIGALWWCIDALVKPATNSVMYQIFWSFIYIGLIFGTGFAILAIFVSYTSEEKHEGS